MKRILVIYRDPRATASVTDQDDVTVERMSLAFFEDDRATRLLRGNSYMLVVLDGISTVEELQVNEDAWRALRNSMQTYNAAFIIARPEDSEAVEPSPDLGGMYTGPAPDDLEGFKVGGTD